MKVKVSDLLPNQHRDFNLYPLDPDQIERLRHSLNDLGFFQGVTVRPHPTERGKYELACGHHRIEAAKAEGIATVEATVNDYTDAEMARIMIVENLTQRGNNPAATLDSVAAAARHIVSEEFSTEKFFGGTGSGATAQRDHILKSGPGIDSIFRFINGFDYEGSTKEERKDATCSLGDMRAAIKGLKDSGLMTTIVQMEYDKAKAIADAEAEAREKAEAERIAKEEAEAERQRKAAEAKAEAERKAAEAEAERQRKAAEAAEAQRIKDAKDAEERKQREAEAEAARKQREAEAEAKRKADAAKRKAEEEKWEKIAADKKKERERLAKEKQDRQDKQAAEREKLRAQAELEAVYDIRCVHVFNAVNHEKIFREWIVDNARQAAKDRDRPCVAKDKQLDLAKELRAFIDTKEARSRDAGGSSIRGWLNDKAMELLKINRQLSEREKQLRMAQNDSVRVGDLWKSLNRWVVQAESALEKLVNEQRNWEHPAPFPIDAQIVQRFEMVASRVSKLSKCL